jgi:peptide deformylase
MAAMMRTQQHGIGIAAPQIGISMQIALVDVSSRVPGAKALVLINPKLLSFSEPYPSREGCMSIPDYTSLISRYRSVRAGWYDLDGNYREGDFTGIEAVCIQHEIDHLGGILFIDRVVSLKRDLIPRPRSFKAQ